MVERAFDVLTVGEVLMDFVAPDADDLASATAFQRTPGGAPANVAVAVARLGGRSAFAGAVGEDAFGRVLRDLLDENGVDITGLRAVPEHTTLAIVAKNAGGIPDFVFYRGSDMRVTPESIDPAQVGRAAFVYVSSMALLSEPSAGGTQFAVEAAREAETLVAMDPNLRPTSWPSLDAARDAILPVAREADVLKINDEEARILADTADLDEAIDRLSGDRTLLIVSMGADGARWSWGGREGTMKAAKVKVRDTTGAGDAFMGALLYHLARHAFSPYRVSDDSVRMLEDGLRFACAAGSCACTQVGAMSSLPTREQVEKLLG